jgi:hypothetical protein
MLERRSLRGISRVFLSSRDIAPEVDSTIRKMAEISVDLPAPVLPTTPTFSPGLIVKLRLRRTAGNPSL